MAILAPVIILMSDDEMDVATSTILFQFFNKIFVSKLKLLLTFYTIVIREEYYTRFQGKPLKHNKNTHTNNYKKTTDIKLTSKTQHVTC